MVNEPQAGMEVGAGPGPSMAAEPEMSPLEIYYMVRARWWLLLPFTLLLGAAAVVHVQTATPVYEARCGMVYDPGRTQLVQVEGVYDPAPAMRDLDATLATELEVMRSRDILAEGLDVLRLGEQEEYLGSLDPVGAFAGNLGVSRKRGTFLIDVTYRSPRAQEAATVANTMADLFVRRFQDRKREISDTGVERLRGQVGDLAKGRQAAREALIAYRQQENMIEASDARKLLNDRMVALNTALMAARQTEAGVLARYEALRGWRDGGGRNPALLAQALQGSVLTSLRIDQLKAEAQMPELLSKYGPTHTAVKTQNEVIRGLERAITAEIAGNIDVMQLECDQAKRNTTLLESELTKLETASLDLDRKTGQYEVLEDAYKAAEEAYRMIINRISEIDMSRNAEDTGGAGSLRVRERAQVPRGTVYPRKSRTVGGAAAVGLALGAALCILLGWLDTTIKGKEEVEAITGVSVLGEVPPVEKGQELLSVEDTKGPLSEAFRGIRTSLRLGLGTRNQRVFMIVSAEPGEGKTLVSFSLAVSLAREAKRVLLIESDMRRPRLKRLLADKLGGRDPDGLSKVLVGDATLDEVAWPVPGLESLTVVFSGAHPPNPAELLASERFDALLANLGTRYDTVIIDTPAVLNVTDTTVMAGRGIPVVFVARVFRTHRRAVQQALHQLRLVGANVVGAIVNHAEAARGRGGYYSYYYRRYYSYRYYSYPYQYNDESQPGSPRRQA